MLAILEDAEQIRSAMDHFRGRLVDTSDHCVRAVVGFPGGVIDDNIYQFLHLGYWYCPNDLGLNRYWNGFGSQPPRQMASVPIDVEINFPKDGLNRSVAGAFVVDHLTGDLYVVHRGRIGGGRKGVSKSAFWEHFRGAHVSVADGNREAYVAMVASMNSPRFSAQVGDFVAEVRRIKALITGSGHDDGSDANESVDESGEFSPEFAGGRSFDVPGHVDAQCDHGLVVNRLAALLLKAGHKIANDLHRDLVLIGQGSEARMLFEVKTDPSLTSVQQGLGQLMLHGRATNVSTQLVLVAPEGIYEEVASRLKTLGVYLMSYSWERDVPVFPALTRLLAMDMAR